MEYGLDLYKHCYSRNVFHPNEESRKKEARNLYCLVNRQFLGGYKTLVPIYCTPPSSHPPSSEICLGGRRRQQKGREQLPLAVGKVWSSHLNMTQGFPHILLWQRPANREERAIFFSKITVCQYFLSGETLLPPHLWYSCLPNRLKERGDEEPSWLLPCSSILQAEARWWNILSRNC